MSEPAASQPTRAFLQSHGLDLPANHLDLMLIAAIATMQRTLYRSDPRADLTAAEAEALERAGFELEPGDLGPEDPLARSAADYAALLKTGLDTAQAAELLQVDRSRIRQRLTSAPPSLYGIRLDNSWRIPTFQLDGNRPLPGLAEVLAELDPGLHPGAVYRWFVSPHSDLRTELEPETELSPRDWLRLGLAPQSVADLARNL